MADQRTGNRAPPPSPPPDQRPGNRVPPTAHKDPAEVPWRTVHRRKNTDFLFSEDIGPAGTSIDLEVIGSGIGAVQDVDGKTPMPWISFRGARKILGLNRTNSKRMETLAGTNIVSKWRGWVTLVVVRSSYTDRKTKERWTTDAIKLAPERPRNPRKGMYIIEAPLPAEPTADAAEERSEPVFTDEVIGGEMTDEEQAAIARMEAERQE